MLLARGGCCMSPLEDALLLFAIVRRHLQVLQLGLDEAYPAEDWGFTAQQAVEKLLKAWIVLSKGQPTRVHDLTALAELSGLVIPPILLALQVYAVEARYEEGPFPLPADRSELLAAIQQLLAECERAAS